MHKSHYYIISLLSLMLLIIMAIGLNVSGLLPIENKQAYSLAPSDGLHVSGTKIVDGNGNTVLLRGAQVEILNRNIPSADWNNFSTTVSVMKNTWHMNVVRLPTCAWRWQASPTSYMNSVVSAVNTATNAGLYVVIDSHDDHNCNPQGYDSTTESYHLPRPGMDSFIEALATSLGSNPKVIFDMYNEPAVNGRSKDKYTNADWVEWLNGGSEPDGYGGTVDYLGEQTLVNDFRKIDSSSLVMVEGYAHAETYIGINNNFVHDPSNSLVYEVHNYSMNPTGSQNGNKAYWQTEFGFMGGSFPLFIGEWALMGGGNSGQDNCTNTSPAQADSVTTWFLDYMATNGWGWTAYAFKSGHLIDPKQDSTLNSLDYTPTTFDGFSWTCGTQTPPIPGMGSVILSFLSPSQPPPVPTPSPTPSPNPSPSSSGSSSGGTSSSSGSGKNSGSTNGANTPPAANPSGNSGSSPHGNIFNLPLGSIFAKHVLSPTNPIMLVGIAVGLLGLVGAGIAAYSRFIRPIPIPMWVRSLLARLRIRL